MRGFGGGAELLARSSAPGVVVYPTPFCRTHPPRLRSENRASSGKPPFSYKRRGDLNSRDSVTALFPLCKGGQRLNQEGDLVDRGIGRSAHRFNGYFR